MAKYDLSVAIIFKNEIRCLERCLKSLQPLRERLSLQVVMADTGSTDGSREVAEQYADVLFDFPWINDFAAARNAVLERCRGKWALVLDCDEWLKDCGELVAFVRSRYAKQADRAALTIRNYLDAELEQYEEFPLIRLMRMDARPRYVGAIHEIPVFPGRNPGTMHLTKTVIHHDGYVMLNDNSAAGEEKRKRNVELLRKELENNQNDLQRRMQLLEIGNHEPDYLEQIRKTVNLVKAKTTGWETYGPPVLRLAVFEAYNRKLPELDEWEEIAKTWFAKSYFTRLDLNFLFMERAFKEKDYGTALVYGKAYLEALSSFKKDPLGVQDNSISLLERNAPDWEAFAHVRLAETYQKLGQTEQGLAALDGTPWDAILERRILGVLQTLKFLYDGGGDISSALLAFWNSVYVSGIRKQGFFIGAGIIMLGEPTEENMRSAWGMFRSLQGKCILGDAVALLYAETAEEADVILAEVVDPSELPPAAFVHALQLGAEFPIPGKALTTDQIAALAEKLLIDPPFLREAAKFAASAAQTEQEVMWAYALAKVALNQATAELEQKREEDVL